MVAILKKHDGTIGGQHLGLFKCHHLLTCVHMIIVFVAVVMKN